MLKLDPEHPRLVSAIQGLGELRLAQRRLAEAEELLRSALGMRRRRYGTSHPLIAVVLLPLGKCLVAEGRIAEAETVWREALPMAIAGQRPRLEARLRAELASISRARSAG